VLPLQECPSKKADNDVYDEVVFQNVKAAGTDTLMEGSIFLWMFDLSRHHRHFSF
jgi:hypothetical protein